jgi:hypothetical protein
MSLSALLPCDVVPVSQIGTSQGITDRTASDQGACGMPARPELLRGGRTLRRLRTRSDPRPPDHDGRPHRRRDAPDGRAASIPPCQRRRCLGRSRTILIRHEPNCATVSPIVAVSGQLPWRPVHRRRLHRGRIIIPDDERPFGNLRRALAAPARDEDRRESGIPEKDRHRIVDDLAKTGRRHHPTVGAAILVESGIDGIEPSAETACRNRDPDAHREAALCL